MMHHEFEFQLDEHGEYVATYRQPSQQARQPERQEVAGTLLSPAPR